MLFMITIVVFFSHFTASNILCTFTLTIQSFLPCYDAILC